MTPLYGISVQGRTGWKTGLCAALAACLMAAAAAAQEAEDAEDAAAEETAAEAAPAAPANLEACGAARCLDVRLSPDLEQAMGGDGVTLDQLAEGLVFDYQGPEPVRVYFVASRYDDDRLVRYDVSEAIVIEPGQAVIPDAATVLQKAFGPHTESAVTAALIEPEIAAESPELPPAGFVGSMPGNTLMGLIRPDLTEPLTLDQRDGLNSVGVLALIPRDQELREGAEGKSLGAVVRLNYVE